MRRPRPTGSRRLRLSIALSITFAASLASLVLPIGTAPAGASGGVSVSVGYADTLRLDASNFPTPWEGPPNVIFEGCDVSACLSGGYDGGAVKVTNNTSNPVVVDYVKVVFDACTYDIWPHSTSLPAGDSLIVDQTAPGGGSGCTPGTYLPVSGGVLMDSSDIGLAGANWVGNCTNSGLIPEVDVSVDGTALPPFQDTGQVLNTGGVDGADCPHGSFTTDNESTQWTPIGNAPCVGTNLVLAPPSQTHPIFSTATVTGTLTNGCGDPLPGVAMSFSVLSGPNAGVSGSSLTDSSGSATFSYFGKVVGTDTLQASVTNPAGTISSNEVSVIWINQGSAIHSVIQVETNPSYADDTVNIDSSQLQASCGGTIVFETLQGGTTTAPRTSFNSIQVVLDDDGNATVVVEGAPCAAGTDVIDASLTTAPYLTALTTLDVAPPEVTPAGVSASPNPEVETGNSPASGNSDVYTVFTVETDPVYAEQPVEISSPELDSRCIQGWRWESATGATIDQTSGTNIATGMLDDDGNATFVFKGAGCAAGDSAVIADVLAGTRSTYTTTFTIDAPMPTASVRMNAAKATSHHRKHKGKGGSSSGSGGSNPPMTVTASPNPLVETG